PGADEIIQNAQASAQVTGSYLDDAASAAASGAGTSGSGLLLNDTDTLASGTTDSTCSEGTTAAGKYDDPADKTRMAVDSSLATSVPPPFIYANMSVVVGTDTRVVNSLLNDAAQTAIRSETTAEDDRYWVSANGPVTCGPLKKHIAVNFAKDNEVD